MAAPHNGGFRIPPSLRLRRRPGIGHVIAQQRGSVDAPVTATGAVEPDAKFPQPECWPLRRQPSRNSRTAARSRRCSLCGSSRTQWQGYAEATSSRSDRRKRAFSRRQRRSGRRRRAAVCPRRDSGPCGPRPGRAPAPAGQGPARQSGSRRQADRNYSGRSQSGRCPGHAQSNQGGSRSRREFAPHRGRLGPDSRSEPGGLPFGKALEQSLELRNDVGLLSEEYDLRGRRLCGDFPQALNHLGVVTTALGPVRTGITAGRRISSRVRFRRWSRSPTNWPRKGTFLADVSCRYRVMNLRERLCRQRRDKRPARSRSPPIARKAVRIAASCFQLASPWRRDNHLEMVS